MVRSALRSLIQWAQSAPQPAPPPLLTPQQHDELSSIAAQYWQWELEALKHLIVIAGTGLAGTVTLGGAGLFNGHGDKLMWSVYCFSASLMFAYLAIWCGARSFEYACSRSRSGRPMAAGRPSMLAPVIVGLVSLVLLVVGLGYMYFGSLDGMIKRGLDGKSPPPEKTIYAVRCTTVQRAASIPAAKGTTRKADRDNASDMTCQISS